MELIPYALVVTVLFITSLFVVYHLFWMFAAILGGIIVFIWLGIKSAMEFFRGS